MDAGGVAALRHPPLVRAAVDASAGGAVGEEGAEEIDGGDPPS